MRDDPVKNCPLCRGSDIAHLHTIEGFSEPFSYDRCDTCGFIFQNPPFSDTYLAAMYGKEYYEGSAEYRYVDERAIKKYAMHVWKARIGMIRRWIDGGPFLDVGCSFGGLLEAAECCYEPYGIDLSQYALDDLRARKEWPLHQGTLQDHPFPENHFSVISMVEVIEHEKDPRQYINESYRLLKKGGLLLVQTANMDGWQARRAGSDYSYYLPGHVSCFTQENLSGLMREAGFSRIKVWRPVDFGLLPKLLKSRGEMSHPLHYLRWLRIARYHWKSKFCWKGFPLTSSMVIYAQK